MSNILLQISSTATPSDVSKLTAKARLHGAVRVAKKYPRDRNEELRRLYVVVPGSDSDAGGLQSALRRDPIVNYVESSDIERKLIKPIRSSTGKPAG